MVRYLRPETLGLVALACGAVALPMVRGLLIGYHGVAHTYTVLSFVARQIRMGMLASWNPYMLSGIPQIADIPTAFLYPLTIPLILVLPLRDAMNAFVIAHLILAGTSMYLYLGTILRSRACRFLGATIYMLAGFTATRILAGDTQRLPVYALIPLTLYLAEEIIQRRQGTGAAVLGGVVIACQFLAGDPQTFVYATLALVAYAVARLVHVHRRRAGEHDRRGTAPDSAVRPTLLLVGMFVTAMGFAAIQVLPTLQLYLLSNRPGFDPSFAFVGSIPPPGLLTLLAPHVFGDEAHFRWGEGELGAPDFYPHSSTLYVGFFTLALAIVALLSRRDRWHVRFFGLMGLAVVWLALGKYGFLYRAVVYVPVLRNFRDIEDLNLLVPLCAAVLAGVGFERYLEPDAPSGLWRRVFRILLLAVAAGLTLLDLTIFLVWRIRGVVLSAYPPIRGLLVESAIFVLVALGLSAWLLRLRARTRTVPGWHVAGVIAFVLADLLYAGFPFTSAGTDIRTVEQPDPVIRYLARDRSLYRVLGTGDRSPLFDVQDVEGEVGLLPARYSEYTNYLQHYPLDSIARPAGVHGVLITQGQDSPLLSLLGVKYMIWHMDRKQAEVIRRFAGVIEVVPGTFIYQNRRAVPQILDAYGYVVLADRVSILKELSRPGFDPRRRVILDTEPHLPPGGPAPDGPPGPHAALRIVLYEANRVIVHARFDRPGFLVLNDPYYPAWTASVDGRPTTIYRANYVFRAVAVPAGDHEVRFVYRDRALALGAAIAGATGLLGTLVWLADRIRRRREAAPNVTAS